MGDAGEVKKGGALWSDMRAGDWLNKYQKVQAITPCYCGCNILHVELRGATWPQDIDVYANDPVATHE